MLILIIRYALLSPDGRYLVIHIHSFAEGTNSDGLYLVDLTQATPDRMLTTAFGFGSIFKGVSWSPDGEHLVFSVPPNFELASTFINRLVMVTTDQSYFTGGLANDLFIFDVIDGSLICLTGSPRDEASPAWSPDGQQIVFTANDPSSSDEGYFHYDLYVLNLETNVQTQLTEREGVEPEPNDEPVWSPDVQQIAFISWRAPDGPDVYVMPSTGGEPQRLTYFLTRRPDTPLWWSPDGNWIAFSIQEDTYLIPTAGGNPITFPDHNIVGWLPSATPTPTPTSTPNGQDELLIQIDQAEAKWQDQGVDSYYIEVLYVQSIWHAQFHQITVRDGKVVEESATCIPASAESGKCEIEPFKAEDYVIPGLIALARAKAQIEGGQWTQITFDPIYGFPSRISFDHPEIIDEDVMWRVTEFEVLD